MINLQKRERKEITHLFIVCVKEEQITKVNKLDYNKKT